MFDLDVGSNSAEIQQNLTPYSSPQYFRSEVSNTNKHGAGVGDKKIVAGENFQGKAKEKATTASNDNTGSDEEKVSCTSLFTDMSAVAIT